MVMFVEVCSLCTIIVKNRAVAEIVLRDYDARCCWGKTENF